MEDPQHELPQLFLEKMQHRLGEEFPGFLQSYEEKPPVSVRVNPLKAPQLFENEQSVPWCEYGFYLKERPAFIWDPMYHAGAYYAQEASSMLYHNAIDFSKDILALDLCAAPGGKSTLLQSFLTPGSLLVSNEMVGKRVNILYENLVKWGAHNSVVTCNKSADYLPFSGMFDVVLVDAPCSGEGMFRKDDEAVAQWNEGLVRRCSTVQKTILDDAVKLVKQGGLLIYSTCTFEEAENEANIQYLFDTYKDMLEPAEIPVKPEWGMKQVKIPVGNGKEQSGYYCFPHHVKGEGLFVSVIKVISSAKAKLSGRGQPQVRKATNKEKEAVKPFLSDALYGNEIFIREDKAFLANPLYAELYNHFSQYLYMRKMGTAIGQLKGNSVIPDHELALSGFASKQLPRVELDLKNALDYLQRKNISVPLDIANGWFLFAYKGLEIGWAKNLGNRINTHYPAEWRIRKDPSSLFTDK